MALHVKLHNTDAELLFRCRRCHFLTQSATGHKQHIRHTMCTNEDFVFPSGYNPKECKFEFHMYVSSHQMMNVAHHLTQVDSEFVA